MRRRGRTRATHIVAVLLAAALAAAACGDEDPGGAAGDPAERGAELQHVHGIGVDPGSDTLFVATHHGLFSAGSGEQRLAPVGDKRQDTMGFWVAGPGRLIGSGHPDPADDLPPHLGLIESRDGGETWDSVSLLGEADFHVLRSAGRRVYGFDSLTGRLFVSDDAGRRWTRHRPPAAMYDLAIDPGDGGRVVASTEQGMFSSADAGRRWRPLRDDIAGLLAWPQDGSLFLVDGRGEVSRSTDGGRTFEAAGAIGGVPAAFAAQGGDLYAARQDGTVLRSTDGGEGWEVRAAP